MPRTLPEAWIENESVGEPADEMQAPYRWHEPVSTKALMLARRYLQRRAALRLFHQAMQQDTQTCPHCHERLAHRAKIRRISVQQQFNELADMWHRETAHQSNMTKRAMHPAYQRIIGMGPAIVPFMLERFRKGALEHWFWALTAITGENPITEDIAGDIEKMAKAWVQWGTANGYLTDSIQHLKPYSPT